MVEIKEFTEDINDYKNQIDKMKSNIEEADDLVWAEIDGKRYLVTHNSQSELYNHFFSIMSDTENYTVGLDSRAFIYCYFDDDVYYQVDRADDSVLVQRKIYNGSNMQALAYVEPTKEDPRNFLKYMNEIENGRVIFEYDLSNCLHSLETYCEYIDSRIPDIIRYYCPVTLFGKKVRLLKNELTLNPNNDNYYSPCVVKKNGQKIIRSRKLIDREELYKAFRDDGFTLKVDKELVNLFFNKGEKVRKLTEISRAYIEHFTR